MRTRTSAAARMDQDPEPRWARLTRRLLWRAQFYPRRGAKRRRRYGYRPWMRVLALLAPDPGLVPMPRWVLGRIGSMIVYLYLYPHLYYSLYLYLYLYLYL